MELVLNVNLTRPEIFSGPQNMGYKENIKLPVIKDNRQGNSATAIYSCHLIYLTTIQLQPFEGPLTCFQLMLKVIYF
jgi:hypothetical protein